MIICTGYKWMKNIRGYYDRGKIVFNLGCCSHVIYWSVHLSSKRGGNGVNGEDGGDHYFGPLQVSLY